MVEGAGPKPGSQTTSPSIVAYDAKGVTDMRQWAAIFALFLLITVPAVAVAQYDYPAGGGGAPTGGQPPVMNDSGGLTMPGVPDMAMPDMTVPDMTMPSMASDGAVVTIVDFAFQPGLISVPAGTTATWTNIGAAPHTVTSRMGAFDSGTIGSGESFSASFSAPGTYMYHCSIHPNMTGTIQVSGS
jgi:plastocyanin